VFIRAPTLAVSALALSALTIATQEIPPQLTYRTGIDLVQVDVSVLDRDRHAVTGLKQDDFVLRVDGNVKPIAAFTAVALPERRPEPSAAWMGDAGRDVSPTLRPRTGAWSSSCSITRFVAPTFRGRNGPLRRRSISSGRETWRLSSVPASGSRKTSPPTAVCSGQQSIGRSLASMWILTIHLAVTVASAGAVCARWR